MSMSPPPPAMALGSGEFAFSLGETIGVGATGKVKLGVHKETGEYVAIKAIEKGRTDVSAIRREVAILQKVGSHPNIVALRDVFETEDKWCARPLQHPALAAHSPGSLTPRRINGARVPSARSYSLNPQKRNARFVVPAPPHMTLSRRTHVSAALPWPCHDLP